MQKNKNNPYPVKLGDLKQFLQTEAVAADRSLHYWILKILSDYKKTKENGK
jgi:hypothetical protein